MGYSNYLYEVDKDFAKKIRACETNVEYYKLCEERGLVEAERYDGYMYVAPNHIGEEIFDFGKYYANAGEMYKHGDSLFSTNELNEIYQDYEPIVIEKEGLLCAIEWQQKRIIENYQHLMDENYVDEYGGRIPQYDRMKKWVSDYCFWWEKVGAINLDESMPNLARSWLYEHTIFDLVRIYKSFDWENKSMIFLGY